MFATPLARHRLRDLPALAHLARDVVRENGLPTPSPRRAHHERRRRPGDAAGARAARHGPRRRRAAGRRAPRARGLLADGAVSVPAAIELIAQPVSAVLIDRGSATASRPCCRRRRASASAPARRATLSPRCAAALRRTRAADGRLRLDLLGARAACSPRHPLRWRADHDGGAADAILVVAGDAWAMPPRQRRRTTPTASASTGSRLPRCCRRLRAGWRRLVAGGGSRR